ncbi:MAG: isoprenylcysteine carboxylmethyltransferase family protein [Planctomycetota bacterium]
MAYLIGMASLAYLFAWYGNLIPASIDARPINANTTGLLWECLLINFFLFVGFGIQHSVMARPAFKERLSSIIPEFLERSTFVLVSGIALLLMLVLWQPLGGTLWSLENQVVRCCLHLGYVVGWIIVVGSTFALSHTDFFGLRQAWYGASRKRYTPIKFSVPLLYRLVRHPLYVGLILLSWSTPEMSAAHLLFSGMVTGYIVTAIRWEERDLVETHGDDYRRYQQATPRLFPRMTFLARIRGFFSTTPNTTRRV